MAVQNNRIDDRSYTGEINDDIFSGILNIHLWDLSGFLRPSLPCFTRVPSTRLAEADLASFLPAEPDLASAGALGVFGIL